VKIYYVYISLRARLKFPLATAVSKFQALCPERHWTGECGGHTTCGGCYSLRSPKDKRHQHQHLPLKLPLWQNHQTSSSPPDPPSRNTKPIPPGNIVVLYPSSISTQQPTGACRRARANIHPPMSRNMAANFPPKFAALDIKIFSLYLSLLPANRLTPYGPLTPI